MVNRMVSFAKTPVTVCNNQSSAFEFIQDLARTNSCQTNFDSFFVADLGKIHLLVDQWAINLPRVRPFYALNCNMDDMFLRVLASYPQIGFHCITRQHLDTALDFVTPDRLFYSNPCWTRNALMNAQSNNVELMGVDSERDLNRMAASGVKNKLILNICVDSLFGDSNPEVGCEVSKAPELLQLAADLGLDCAGVGFNLGNQRPGLIPQAIECASQLFAIGRSLGLSMCVLNLGGGFPSLFSASHITSFKSICEQINASLDYYFPTSVYDDIEVIATPGRFFASSIFSLATKIVDKFEVDASDITKDDFDAGQKAFVYKISEGFYGPFGCCMMANCEPKCLPLFSEKLSSDEIVLGSILGPNMDDRELDVVQSQCHFRQMGLGEWLLWTNMGAYSMNNTTFLDDDDQPNMPSVYYFSKENDWKFIDSTQHMDLLSTFGDAQSDGESVISSEDSGAIDLETIEDSLWMFDWLTA